MSEQKPIEAGKSPPLSVAGGSAPMMPPGRDNIPLNHPRRIARIAHSPAHSLGCESPEVQRLCAEYREGKRAPQIYGIPTAPELPREVAAKIKLLDANEWTEADWADLHAAQCLVRYNIAARHGLLPNTQISNSGA